MLPKNVVIFLAKAMKAHDWHIFMQQLLPLCLRGLMDQ
jgi:hypothetical protein